MSDTLRLPRRRPARERERYSGTPTVAFPDWGLPKSAATITFFVSRPGAIRVDYYAGNDPKEVRLLQRGRRGAVEIHDGSIMVVTDVTEADEPVVSLGLASL